jgi:multidrug resistance efflux pump
LAVVDSDSFRVKAYLEETKTILSSGMTATVRIKPKHESEEEDRPVFRESRAGRP